MYAWMVADVLVRIVVAFAFLFLVVPLLARKRPASLDRFAWFWWCFAAGQVMLTLVGQVLSLLNSFSVVTLLPLIVLLILLVRSRTQGRGMPAIVQDVYRRSVFVTLEVLERRINVRRRLRRAIVRGRRRAATYFDHRRVMLLSGWTALIIGTAVIRFVRPFLTANLGFSDTYVHLYLMRLLEQGIQVDPAWGPYPRGMHFLLFAIHELTNSNLILLMNCFGPMVGVLMTVAVADAARRLVQRAVGDGGEVRAHAIGLTAGVFFATMIGGRGQYYLFGGGFAAQALSAARSMMGIPYDALPDAAGEFDVLLTAFKRQGATLPQELAVVFLFPAALFLLEWFRTRDWWNLSGFLACSAAIATVHTGVVLPLVILCGVSALVALLESHLTQRMFWKAVGSGAVAILVGSSWILGFIRYPYAGDLEFNTSDAYVGAGLLYYFPFLRESTSVTTGIPEARTWMEITPFLVLAVIAALFFIVRAFRSHPDARGALLWPGCVTIVFFLTHAAATLRLPEIVEPSRAIVWFSMAVAILLALALAQVATLAEQTAERRRPVRHLWAGILIFVIGLWFTRVPNVMAAPFRNRLLNYSGYGMTAFSVLRIEQKFEPFTWTVVSYGQEFPMVLGRGFHMAGVEFLDNYDPTMPLLTIPTKYVFIIVETTPHQFEVNTWAARFSRADIEQRLQTWCFLYQLTHKNIRVFSDDQYVRVYMIERTDEEMKQILKAQQAEKR